MKRAIVFVLAAMLLVSAAVFAGGSKEAAKEASKSGKQDQAPAAAAKEAPMIKISSGSLGGSWYPFGAALGENILKPSGFQYTNEPGGGVSNIVAVSTAKTDIGITMTTSIAMAEVGEGPFKGVKYTNLVVLARLFDDPLHILVPKNSNINSVADLKGRKIASAASGQLAETVMLDVFAAYGIKPGDVTLQKGDPTDHIALYKDGHVDSWIYIMPPPSPQCTDMVVSRPSKFINLTNADLEKLSKIRTGYSLYTMPSGTYPGINEPAVMLNTDVVFVARSDMSDDVAYKITKALVERRSAFGDSIASMKGIAAKDLANLAPTVKVHPGAAKYYREIGAMK